MSQPIFGLQFLQVDDQSEPVLGANMDVVGIVGPCSTADAYAFPINTPVLVFSNDTITLAKLGDGFGYFDGYIMDAINGINDQLADFQQAAQLVIVLTPYGTAADANLKLQQTIANVMGSSGTGTGIWALTTAPMTLYCTPRLITCPGYTGQMANSLDTLTAQTHGTGYIPNAEYTVNFAPGAGETNGANLVLPSAHAVADANGVIDNPQLFIDGYGAWFTVAPTATIVAPDGSPPPAQPAQGQIIFSRNPGIGSTINLNGTTVTFVSSGATGNQVNLMPDLASTLNNLLTFLNGSADSQIAANNYTLLQGTLNITQVDPGSAGNGYTLNSTVTGASLSGPTLRGGTDAVTPQQVILHTTMSLGANPVCASLTPVLDQLIAHAVVEGPGTSAIADENWRTTMNSQRLIPMAGGIKVVDPNSGDVIVRPVAPRVIGCIVAEDFRTGYPFHSCANRPIQGVVGPARVINFSLTDGATEGQMMLGANLGIVVRGLVGVETSISSGGFILITTDNAGDDPLWQMWNVKRGRDYIHLSLMPALRVYLGRNNIDRQTITNVLITIRDFLGTLKARQQILGYDVSFQGNLNTADQIRLGHLTVSFAAEEPPVLKLITTMSARYKPAIDAMVAQLAQQLNFVSV